MASSNVSRKRAQRDAAALSPDGRPEQSARAVGAPKGDDPRIKLALYRRRIDAIDRKLLALLNQRGKIAQKIGAVKRIAGMPVVEPGREQQVVSNMISSNNGPLPSDSVERIFAGVMIEMRNLQREGKD